MADFSPHHSLLLKATAAGAAIATTNDPNISSFFLYNHSHGSQAPQPANAAAAAIVEDASLESSVSAVLDTSPSVDRKRKAAEDSAHSKVANNWHNQSIDIIDIGILVCISEREHC